MLGCPSLCLSLTISGSRPLSPLREPAGYAVALLPFKLHSPVQCFVTHLLAVREQSGQASEESGAPQGVSFPGPVQEAPPAKCRLQPAGFRPLARTSLGRFPCQPH